MIENYGAARTNEQRGSGLKGIPMSHTEIRCQNCATLNPPNNKFCGNCGYPLVARTAIDPPKIMADIIIDQSVAQEISLERSAASEGIPEAPKRRDSINIPPEYARPVNGLIDSDDKLIAWYDRNHLEFYLENERFTGSGYQKNTWYGDGIAVARRKLILFGSGCLSGIEVKVSSYYGPTQEVKPLVGRKRIEVGTSVGKLVFYPKNDPQNDELLQVFSKRGY